MSKLMFSSATPEWRTPGNLLNRVRLVGEISLDPCAHPFGLVKAKREIFPPADGLAEDWDSGGGLVFVNPPYGRAIANWCAKCAVEYLERGTSSLALLPARTDTAWWQDTVTVARRVCFLRGRVRFLSDSGEGDAAPFPSALVLWTPSGTMADRFDEAFRPLGWIP